MEQEWLAADGWRLVGCGPATVAAECARFHYIPELTCEQRLFYGVEPLCEPGA